MNFFKSRLAIAICAFALAAVVCFVAIPLGVNNQSKVESVPVLTQDIAIGTTITSAMISEKQMGTYGLPSGVVMVKGDIVGQVAIKELSTNHFVCSTDIVDEQSYQENYGIESLITDDVQLVSVLVKSLSASVSGQISPGSVVDVACTRTEDIVNPDTYQTSTRTSVRRPEELKGLVVYSVFNNALEADSQNGSSFVPAVVTFIANEQQADSLMAIEYSLTDNLHILLNK